MAEIVLAAGKEREIGWQRRAEFIEETDQTAVMVEVAVADDQRLDLLRIGADQFEVVEKRGGRVAEIE